MSSSTGLVQVPLTTTPKRRMTPVMWLGVVIGGLILTSIVRTTTGADNLTSIGGIQSAIIAAMPIALAGLAGLWSERAGVVNIGLEGMMILGTFGCGWAGYQWGPWAGVFVGIVCGMLGGLLMGLAIVTFGVDHIIAGVAISIVAPGLALYLAQLLFTNAPGGGAQQSPPVANVGSITIPGLSSWMATLAGKHWFLVSDIAGILGGVSTALSLLAVLTVLLIIVSGFVMWRTRFGLRLRSVGEAPYAAETLGVNVIRYKYIGVTISGALSGLAGASLVAGQRFQNGQTGGRGYIGLASLIFGNWRPGGMAMGALLFGYTDGVQQYDPTGLAMHAFLLLVAAGLVVVAIIQIRAGARLVGIVAIAIAALAVLWFVETTQLPSELVSTSPYAITLLVMGLASQRLRPPKADGMPYRKGGGRMNLSTPVDWEPLRAMAVEAAHRAYCPYSGLQVGVAALVDDGRIVTGCNVENASYGLGLCAECTMVGQLRLTGGGRLAALACRSGKGELLMPCGRCRQVIYEFGGPDLLVDTPSGIRPMSWVLPDAFGPEHLPG